jgi:hypothetical protein
MSSFFFLPVCFFVFLFAFFVKQCEILTGTNFFREFLLRYEGPYSSFRAGYSTYLLKFSAWYHKPDYNKGAKMFGHLATCAD